MRTRTRTIWRRRGSASLVFGGVWRWFFLVSCLFHHCHRQQTVWAKGRGPVGLQMLPDGRHVLVADSSVPGLVLVDLQYGMAVERLVLPPRHCDVTSVATCANCRYIFVTATQGHYLVVYLPHSVRFLLRHYGQLGFFHQNRVEQWVPPPGQAVDGRLAVATPLGHEIFFASYRDNAVYVVQGMHQWKPLTTNIPTTTTTTSSTATTTSLRGTTHWNATTTTFTTSTAREELEKEDIRRRRRRRQRRRRQRRQRRTAAATTTTRRRTRAAWYATTLNKTLHQEPTTAEIQTREKHTTAVADLPSLPSEKKKQKKAKKEAKKAAARFMERPFFPKVLLNATHEPELLNPFGISWSWQPPPPWSFSNSSLSPPPPPPPTPPYLWIVMHKEQVYKVDRVTGRVVQKVHLGNCPGMERDPNLRQAMDDFSTVSSSSLLVLASFSKTYEAVVWRVRLLGNNGNNNDNNMVCTILFGGFGRQSNWVDSFASTRAMFSRPHDFVRYTPPPALAAAAPAAQKGHPSTLLIATDIDNRALRLLNVSSGQTFSVMYNRDWKLQQGTNALPSSPLSCRSIVAKNFSTTFTSQTPLGQASVVVFPQQKEAMTREEAQSHCFFLGMRLCEPLELRRVLLSRETNTNTSSTSTTTPPLSSWWTRAECASCWKARPQKICPPSVMGNYRPQQNHGHHFKGFEQGWNSGLAMELFQPPQNSAATLEDWIFASTTHCPGPGTTPANAPRANVPCCADCF